jgi:hypothetical protein
MRTHRPWQPRMRTGTLFNPFAPTTEAPREDDHIEIPEEEDSEQSMAPEAGAAPTQDPQVTKDR